MEEIHQIPIEFSDYQLKQIIDIPNGLYRILTKSFKVIKTDRAVIIELLSTQTFDIYNVFGTKEIYHQLFENNSLNMLHKQDDTYMLYQKFEFKIKIN